MEKILVLDFGGQYNQLIARRVRDLHVYAEIEQYNAITPEEIKSRGYKGIIFTGGPNSVYDMSSPHYDTQVLELGIPILGICYGCQLTAWMAGGSVITAETSEYGKIRLDLKKPGSKLFQDVPAESIVWMSHTDRIEQLPQGFEITASTDNCPVAAMENEAKGIYAVQYHPEVTHSQFGSLMLKNFLYNVCKCAGDWQMDSFIEDTVKALKERIGDKKVILGLSGGVDSSVAAGLISRAVGDQLTCVFVDQGLMRKDEGDFVEKTFTSLFDMHFVRVNCQEHFLECLKGVTDPEQKRKIIGAEFVRTFEEESNKLPDVKYLAQGTIYPDVIESGGNKAATIKSHHNVGGLPKDMKFIGVVEPLRGLFKDEVRALGRQLGLPEALVSRQPFPGPGLGVRVIGELTPEKLEILRDADAIFREEMDKHGIKADQYFAVLTNTHSVGVVGDFRTYDYTIALRAVKTSDFMTCEYVPVPHEVLGIASARIVNEVKGAGRVVYDITGKPPATIEWE